MLGSTLDSLFPSRKILYNFGRAEAESNKEKLQKFVREIKNGQVSMMIEVSLFNALNQEGATSARQESALWQNHSFLRGYCYQAEKILQEVHHSYILIQSDELWENKEVSIFRGLSTKLENISFRIKVVGPPMSNVAYLGGRTVGM